MDIPPYVQAVLTQLQAPPATPEPDPLSQALAVGLIVLYAVFVVYGLSWIFTPRVKDRKEEEEEQDEYPPLV